MLCTCFIEYTFKDKNKYTCSYSGILFQYVIDSEVGGELERVQKFSVRDDFRKGFGGDTSQWQLVAGRHKGEDWESAEGIRDCLWAQGGRSLSEGRLPERTGGRDWSGK